MNPARFLSSVAGGLVSPARKRHQSEALGINKGAIERARAAFGGMKESGTGREGLRHGLEEFVELKCMMMWAGPLEGKRGLSPRRQTLPYFGISGYGDKWRKRSDHEVGFQ